jgi:excinuclease UvrABC nuclease subunit
MTETASNFTHAAAFDPAQDFDAFLKDCPAKWVVYLMADADDRPVQLLCVKNLRYSLKRRLGEPDPQERPSKRVDYRQIVRTIRWRRVYSAFEADAVYLEAARQFFPQTYRGMLGFQPCWFIHVNPDAPFPRYTKTIDLNLKTGFLIGPVEDKHVAGRLMDDVVDWFDLCRYYNILVEAPHGAACAYKEMGKCPAPCDGSISMDHYRQLVEWSARTLVAPEELLRETTERMKAAAAELRFETAAKIKQFIDSLSRLGKGPLRYVRRLRDFKYLAIQRGPRDGSAKVFLVTPGHIEEIAALIDVPLHAGELLRLALETDESHPPVDSLDPQAAEWVALTCWHLFSPKAAHGAFIPLDTIDEKSIIKAFKDLQKQKQDESPEESEGVMKELQSL